MRKRETAWVDPRFRKKRDQPKAIKLNQLGEAPCPIQRPSSQRSIPSAGPSRMTEMTSRTAKQSYGGMGLGAVVPPQARAPQGLKPPSTQSQRVVISAGSQQTAPQMRRNPLVYRPGIPIATTQRPCSPSPPCPPEPCPDSCAAPQRTVPSGLPRRSGLRPPTAGLRPPMSTATNLTARRTRSPSPCAPEPSCLPAPCPRGPTSSTPEPRRPQSRLRQPSRLMAPGSFLRQSKPQKIVLLPGDINPQETTVITVEPPLSSSRQQTASGWTGLDLSPPSMDSFHRFVLPRAPYIPPEVEAMGTGQEDPCEQEDYDAQPQLETSAGLLIDVSPPDPWDPCPQESQIVVEPVDLISFPPQDPFSPERRVRPPSPSVSPPPHPFSPPESPYPEPSALHKWYSQYPQYRRAFTSTHHPIMEYSRLRRERPPPQDEGRTPAFVDREVLARSVPFNKHVSTICKDDSDDEDLGLLPDYLGEQLNAPVDYAAIRRQEEMEREERRARRKEQERREKGPTLAETKEMLEMIREREACRREQLAANPLSDYRPPPISMQESRDRYRRIMARAGRLDKLTAWGGPDTEIRIDMPPGNYDCLQDIQLDDIDLDAIDMMEDCPDPFGDLDPCQNACLMPSNPPC